MIPDHLRKPARPFRARVLLDSYAMELVHESTYGPCDEYWSQDGEETCSAVQDYNHVGCQRPAGHGINHAAIWYYSDWSPGPTIRWTASERGYGETYPRQKSQTRLKRERAEKRERERERIETEAAERVDALVAKIERDPVG